VQSRLQSSVLDDVLEIADAQQKKWLCTSREVTLLDVGKGT